jgi:glutaredoxin
MMKWIRLILGKIILTLDALFRPSALLRGPEDQQKVDLKTSSWRLYQLNACPFCVKVRRELVRLSLQIPLVDIKDPRAAKALIEGGKQDQVPCLMIPEKDGTIRWMYESSEIISFLQNQFSASA